MICTTKSGSSELGLNFNPGIFTLWNLQPIVKLSENNSCAQYAFHDTVHSDKSIQSSGNPPRLSFCPKENSRCPTSPSDHAAIRVVQISPKVGTARSMQKRQRGLTSTTNGIQAPTNATVHPGGRPGKHSLKDIPSASCAEGRGEQPRRWSSTTSMPPDRAVPMTRRTSWPCVQAAIPPSTDERKMMGCTGNFS